MTAERLKKSVERSKIMKNKKALRKLKNNSGESLAETLISLLIAAVALVMLAATIAASAGIISKGRNKLNDYYSENEKSAGIVKMTDSGEETGATETVVISADGENDYLSESVKVEYYKNTEIGMTPVISYKYDTTP